MILMAWEAFDMDPTLIWTEIMCVFFLLIVKVPFIDHDIDNQGSNLTSYSELFSLFLLNDC